MAKRCADCGFDLAGGLVEVVPTAHYFMGGIECDTYTRTDFPGLYVAGEDAGGAHGANRLGGNGVANSTVFGGIAGEIMASDIKAQKFHRDPDEALLAAEIERARYPFKLAPANLKGDKKKPENIHKIRSRLETVMWDHVGIMRDAQGLKKGLDAISHIKQQMMHCGLDDDDMVFNPTWHDWLNVRSLVEISEVIAKAALSRQNSRGAHFREDYQEQGDFDKSYFTRCTFDIDHKGPGQIKVEHKDIEFTIIKPGETLVEGLN